MELTPEERERIYEEEKVRFEARRKIEAEFANDSSDAPFPSTVTVNYRYPYAKWLSFVGVSLLLLGIGLNIYFPIFFDTTVPTKIPTFLPPGSNSSIDPPPTTIYVGSPDLIADRQDGILIGGISSLVGSLFLTAGLVLGGGSKASRIDGRSERGGFGL